MNSCSLDIVDTQNKLKQHAELEAAVISYQDSVDAFKLFGRLLNTQKACEQLNIVSKIDILEKRYNALRKTVNDKKATLESSLKALQMLSKLEDEHIWIQKKEPFCRISSYGISLKRVSSLIAKHKALIDDLNVHEPIIKEFSTSLETLDAPSAIREIIKAKVDLINEKWLLLKSNASQRSIRLHYSRLVHHFYSVVSVFEKWLNSNENADYLNGFVVNLQDIETYQQKIKLMDSLVSKISSALKKNKDLEKLEICQGFIISKKEDIENSHHHPLVFEKDNDVDLIKRKHEQIKIRFGRLMREKTGTH
ncbi:Spectrin alpha chain, non-erythrocytic 1 [Armadillidium vulgare]|nr:Spectrin alpha chain, non-erythrocytic 1 [Armadillidium vulgare]